MKCVLANAEKLTQAHPIIGLVLLALLFFQPILGIVHHIMFKKHQRRVVWSYAHIWFGRILITLGIINGGLGLQLANNTTSGVIAYGVIAGIIWLAWMAAAVYGEVKRHRNLKNDDNSRYRERVSSEESQITEFRGPSMRDNPQELPAVYR